MRSTAKLALRFATLGLGAAAAAGVAIKAADQIEMRSEAALRAALDEGGYDWAGVEVDGLLARLTGEAPDEATRFRAKRAAATVLNSDNLRDGMTVAEPAPVPEPELRFEAIRSGSAITVLGLIPGGAEAKAEVLDALSALPGVTSVSDLLSSSPVLPPAGWRAARIAGIRVLDGLDNARVELSRDMLAVSGLAPDQARLDVLTRDLTSDVPDTIALTTDFSLPAPVVSPFVARFTLDETGARFDACSASTEQGRDAIQATARNAGADIASDTCVIAMGAPDTAWDQTVARGIDALIQSGAGTLTVSDITVTITPGDGIIPARFERAMAEFETGLPAGYQLTVLPLVLDEDSAHLSIPEFSATLSPEGLANIRGVTASHHSRNVIESLVGARFPSDTLHVSLRQRQDLPAGWSVRVLAGLDAFSALESGRLNVTPDMLSLHGTTGDPTLSATLASNLTALLGPSTPYLLDVKYVEKLDPVASLPTPEECLGRINDIQANTKITFGPGSTDLDIDALRIVRRIAAVLRECEGVEMEIGGHTDSQGRAEMNTSLSQARADSVFNALIAEQVRASSLSSVGYGEDRPVADNGEEAGREANRRIEFSLRFPLLGPPAPTEDQWAEMAEAAQAATVEADDPAPEDQPAEDQTEQQDGQN